MLDALLNDFDLVCVVLLLDEVPQEKEHLAFINFLIH